MPPKDLSAIWNARPALPATRVSANWESGGSQLKSEPATTPGVVEPEGLTARSSALWHQLIAAGRMKSPGRVPLLEQALRALDLADAARTERERDGLTITNATTGLKHIHPAHRVEKDALATFTACWKALGLEWDSANDGRRWPLS
jgi:hypothetical protein